MAVNLTPLEKLVQRDRTILLVAIVCVTGLCWIYLVRMAQGMQAMDMASAMAMAGIKPWSLLDWVLLLVMWIVMMVGMMMPSATPMILLYAQVARKAAQDGTILVPTGLFALGYLVMWALFSLAATTTQWALDQWALLSPMMVTTSPFLGAAIAIAAGLYQLTPWKNACLQHCRSPVHFLSRHWRQGSLGALRMGFEHGAFCLGCCWVLMALLFVGGVMNLLWIGLITIFVLIEKVLPLGQAGSRWSSLGLIAFGLAIIVGLIRF